MILDHEIPAIGYDPQTAWRGIVEAGLAGALKIELASPLLAVRVRLNEGALQIRQIIEVGIDLVHNLLIALQHHGRLRRPEREREPIAAASLAMPRQLLWG